MKKIKWHLIGIFVYSVYVLSLDILYYKKFYFSSELSALLAEIWVFYSGYSILHFLFLTHKKKKFYSIPALIISLIGAYFAVLLNDWINFYYNKAKFSQSRVIYDTSQVYTHFFIYAIGYFFVERSIQKQKQLRLAEQQKAEAEQQKVEIEKAKLQIENENLRLQDDFLRAQINPHFLYNNLPSFKSNLI